MGQWNAAKVPSSSAGLQATPRAQIPVAARAAPAPGDRLKPEAIKGERGPDAKYLDRYLDKMSTGIAAARAEGGPAGSKIAPEEMQQLRIGMNGFDVKFGDALMQEPPADESLGVQVGNALLGELKEMGGEAAFERRDDYLELLTWATEEAKNMVVR